MLTGHASTSRPRRRHLAHPDAGPHAYARERETISAAMWCAPIAATSTGGGTPTHSARRARAAPRTGGRAHPGQCRDQEGAMPRGRNRARLAQQGPALLGPRLSHALRIRLRPTARLQAAGPGARRRRLRQGSRLVVADSISTPSRRPNPKTPPLTMADTSAGLRKVWSRPDLQISFSARPICQSASATPGRQDAQGRARTACLRPRQRHDRRLDHADRSPMTIAQTMIAAV